MSTTPEGDAVPSEPADIAKSSSAPDRAWYRSTIDQTDAALPTIKYIDPVVAVLLEKDKPQATVICQHCPASMWLTTHNQLKCFCSRLNAFTWESSSPVPITRCAGQIQATAALVEE